MVTILRFHQDSGSERRDHDDRARIESDPPHGLGGRFWCFRHAEYAVLFHGYLESGRPHLPRPALGRPPMWTTAPESIALDVFVHPTFQTQSPIPDIPVMTVLVKRSVRSWLPGPAEQGATGQVGKL